MRKFLKLTMSIVLLNVFNTSAQNVGIGTATPNVSAQLDITATNKGLLIPRVSLTSLADAATIATPATGLLVFNTNAALPGGTGFYYNSGTTAAPAWLKFQTGAGGGSGWGLTGNAGTNSLANFIGTTDNQSLSFGLNNSYAGQLGSLGGIAIGRGSVGGERTNDPGIIAIGDSTLFNNSGDSSAIAIGNNAMFSNSTPGNGDNIAIGHFSLLSSTAGFQNTAVGWGTLALTDTGFLNTAVGYRAGLGSLRDRNTAIGAFSMTDDQIGRNNTAVGFLTLNSNGNGVFNVAVGSQSLVNNFVGDANTAIGGGSLLSDTSGSENTAIGFIAGINIGAGNFNTAVGSAAMEGNLNGNDNIAIGAASMPSNTDGSRNITIGDSSDVTSLGIVNNAIAIGHRAVSTASNRAVIGNTSMTSIGGQVGWTTFSDGRYKKEVEENVSGLNFIMQLRPVTYTYDFDKIEADLAPRGVTSRSRGLIKPVKGNLNRDFSKNGLNLKAAGKGRGADMLTTDFSIKKTSFVTRGSFPNPNEGVRFTGFIAQEVEAAAKKVGYEFSGVDKPANAEANYGLRYAEFTVPLVKAVQEQQAIIEAQNKKIEELTRRLEKLENQ